MRGDAADPAHPSQRSLRALSTARLFDFIDRDAIANGLCSTTSRSDLCEVDALIAVNRSYSQFGWDRHQSLVTSNPNEQEACTYAMLRRWPLVGSLRFIGGERCHRRA